MQVLIADDNEENRYLLEMILQGSGHEVTAVADGVEALEKVLTQTQDMIISDVLMPKMDGFQLCREVKRSNTLRKIPFVFYTANYTSKKDEEFGLSLGADRFVVKPVEPVQFMEIIESLFKDYKNGLLTPSSEISVEMDEEFYLEGHRERLINKLQDKLVELEEANKAQKESESKLRSILSSIIDLVFVFDKNGRFSFYQSLSNEELFIPPEKFIGKKLSEVMPSRVDKKFSEAFNKCMKGEASEFDYWIELNSNTKWYSAKLSPMFMDDKFEGSVGVVRDISERKRVEGQLHQTLKNLRKTTNNAIQLLANTVEVRDPYTSGHQKRVAQLASAIAKEMNFSREQIDSVEMAGLIHDIGKIAVPAEILSKPGRLSEIEFSMIKTHSQIGFDILKGIDFPWPIARIVLHHHERIDGSGYPQGLEGENILIESKIIGVADVVEAMASHRPYRASLGIEKALEEISQKKGICYDAKVVDTCLKLFNKKGFKFEEVKV